MVKRTSIHDIRHDEASARTQTATGQISASGIPHSSDQGARAGAIVIIERRTLIRDCLRRCFELATQVDVIGVRTVDEWLDLAKTASVSLIILSVVGSAKSENAQSDIARLMEGGDVKPMIVLSDGDDLDHIVGMLENGARGYIPTDLSLDVAIEATRLVRAGGVFVPASCLVAARRTGGEAGTAIPRGTNAGFFTTRQAAVVDALRRGKANKVIAYELKMRESTVKVHVRNIMKKLNAKNRTEVAFMANELIRGGDASRALSAR